MSKQLGINKSMDNLALDNGLGHWSCVSPESCYMWLRSDGAEFSKPHFSAYFIYEFTLDKISHDVEVVTRKDIFKAMKECDKNYPIGKDWQQPETEEDFLNRKLPCDIKIGGGVNKAGTSIKTLLLRVNSIIGSQDLVVDKEKQAKAKRMLLDLMNGDNKEDDTDDWQSVDSYQVGVDVASGDDKSIIFSISEPNTDKLLKIALGALNQFADDNDSTRAIKSDIERYLNTHD